MFASFLNFDLGLNSFWKETKCYKKLFFLKRAFFDNKLFFGVENERFPKTPN